jgi:hypothetical protein
VPDDDDDDDDDDNKRKTHECISRQFSKANCINVPTYTNYTRYLLNQ